MSWLWHLNFPFCSCCVIWSYAIKVRIQTQKTELICVEIVEIWLVTTQVKLTGFISSNLFSILCDTFLYLNLCLVNTQVKEGGSWNWCIYSFFFIHLALTLMLKSKSGHGLCISSLNKQAISVTKTITGPASHLSATCKGITIFLLSKGHLEWSRVSLSVI